MYDLTTCVFFRYWFLHTSWRVRKIVLYVLKNLSRWNINLNLMWLWLGSKTLVTAGSTWLSFKNEWIVFSCVLLVLAGNCCNDGTVCYVFHLAAMYQVLYIIRTMDAHAVHRLINDTLHVATNVTMNSFSELVDN